MPHIHTEPGQVDHTVTAFIVRLDGDEPRLLFHVHKKYGKLLPVGGHIEVNETPWSALAHEIREESGYDLTQLDVMQPTLRIQAQPNVIDHPVPLRFNTHEADAEHYHTDLAYLFVTREAPAHELAEGESDDIRWLTRADLEVATEKTTFADARQTGLDIFDIFLHEWEPVPTTDYSTQPK